MFEKNQFAVVTLFTIKNNIMNGNVPIYNPISLIGFDRIKRYEIFFRIFNKEFNAKCRDKIMYVSVEKLDLNRALTKKIVILENIELLVNNKKLQNDLLELLSKCFEKNIQLIICANSTIKELEIDERLKNKIINGLPLYLVDWRVK